MPATFRYQGNGHGALRAGLFRGQRRVLLFQLISPFNKQKDGKGNDGEIDDRIKEETIVDADRFGSSLSVMQHDTQITEINFAEQQADGRHENVGDERRDNFSERAADDNTDSQVDDVAAHGEFFELFKHKVFPDRLAS
jgi:hypothetical protein